MRYIFFLFSAIVYKNFTQKSALIVICLLTSINTSFTPVLNNNSELPNNPPLLMGKFNSNLLFCQEICLANYFHTNYTSSILSQNKSNKVAPWKDDSPTSLKESSVLTNFPNPFTDFTYIYIQLPKEINYQIKDTYLIIYDLCGNVVKEYSLSNANKYFGRTFIIIWDGTNSAFKKVAKGGYICVLYCNGERLVRKIGLVK